MYLNLDMKNIRPQVKPNKFRVIDCKNRRDLIEYRSGNLFRNVLRFKFSHCDRAIQRCIDSQQIRLYDGKLAMRKLRIFIEINIVININVINVFCICIFI